MIFRADYHSTLLKKIGDVYNVLIWEKSHLNKTVLELENLSMQKVQQAGLKIGFSHLLKLRASQINQCAFCVRMHTQDAMKAGESIERIALISAWQ